MLSTGLLTMPRIGVSSYARAGELSRFRRGVLWFGRGERMAYTLTVNGKARTVDVEAETPLLWVLRDTIGLVGAKFGCGIGSCGACTVHLDGVAMRACQVRISAVGAKSGPPIEGVGA